MELVGLDFFTYKDRVVSTLSGGEKRKTALAATLAMNPSMLILDEPTAGLDPLSRKNLLSTLHGLQIQGVQIVISSHNMEDISEIAQNVTVLAKGTSLTTLPVDQLFADQSLSKETGMEPPAAWQLAQSLRKKGWPISYQANTIQAIINETSAAINRGEQ
jgi:ABC-type multidrug transport system ATPase subunit